MRLRTKILLTIALAVLMWSLFGCARAKDTPAPPSTVIFTKTVVTTAYLKDLYRIDNERFFQNKLPKDSFKTSCRRTRKSISSKRQIWQAPCAKMTARGV